MSKRKLRAKRFNFEHSKYVCSKPLGLRYVEVIVTLLRQSCSRFARTFNKSI